MQRELENRIVKRWLAAGPKNYAYEHTDLEGGDLKLTRRIRGFKLSYRASKRLTFEKMRAEMFSRFGGERKRWGKIRG